MYADPPMFLSPPGYVPPGPGNPQGGWDHNQDLRLAAMMTSQPCRHTKESQAVQKTNRLIQETIKFETSESDIRMNESKRCRSTNLSEKLGITPLTTCKQQFLQEACTKLANEVPLIDDNQNARRHQCRAPGMRVNKVSRTGKVIPGTLTELLKDRIELVVYPQTRRDPSQSSLIPSPLTRVSPARTASSPVLKPAACPAMTPGLPNCHMAKINPNSGSTDIEMACREDRKLFFPQASPKKKTSQPTSAEYSPIKKLFSFFSPNSAPVCTSKFKSSEITAPPTCWSPTTKKRVMFDLRRNRANKFSDYLKSLERPATPPCSTKSPSQSILKPLHPPMEISDDLEVSSQAPKVRATRPRRSSTSAARQLRLNLRHDPAYRSRSPCRRRS